MHQSQHNLFWLRKTQSFSCASGGIQTLARPLDLQSNALTIEPTLNNNNNGNLEHPTSAESKVLTKRCCTRENDNHNNKHNQFSPPPESRGLLVRLVLSKASFFGASGWALTIAKLPLDRVPLYRRLIDLTRAIRYSFYSWVNRCNRGHRGTLPGMPPWKNHKLLHLRQGT